MVTNHTLHGKNIVHMTQGSNNLHFFYDAQNRPAVVNFNGTKYGYMHWGKIEMDDQYSIPICYNSSGTFPARPQYGITPGIYQVTIAVYSTVLDHYENGVAKTKNYIALLNIWNKDTTNSDYLTNGMWYRRHMGRSDDDYSRLLRYLTGHE